MLLRLSADGGREREKPQPVLRHIRQADLASVIGATRGRVSYFMNEVAEFNQLQPWGLYNGP
jgi:hypothetical protein